MEEVARLGARPLMQAALQAEVTEFPGRGRYARAASTEDTRPGFGNGYREVTVRPPLSRAVIDTDEEETLGEEDLTVIHYLRGLT